MKKFILILAAVAVALCMGGCGGSASKTGNQEEETARAGAEKDLYKIGVAVYDVTDDEVGAFRDYLTGYIKECFPEVDFRYSYAIRSLEDEMKFLKDVCAEGADGIMSFITYDLEKEVAYCESQGVYYMLASGTASK